MTNQRDALIAALQALHAADLDGGVSMADLRSIAFDKCCEAVALGLRCSPQAIRVAGHMLATIRHIAERSHGTEPCSKGFTTIESAIRYGRACETWEVAKLARDFLIGEHLLHPRRFVAHLTYRTGGIFRRSFDSLSQAKALCDRVAARDRTVAGPSTRRRRFNAFVVVDQHRNQKFIGTEHKEHLSLRWSGPHKNFLPGRRRSKR